MPIFERGKSFVVTVGSGHDRFRQSYKTKDEAKTAELEALLRQKTTGSPRIATAKPELPSGSTLKEAHDLTWRLHWSQDKGKDNHKVTINCVFRAIPHQTLLKDITSDMILEAIEGWEDEGNSGSTVNRKVSHLSMMLKVAMEKGWIDKLPALPRRKEGKHRIRWMDDREEQQVLNACAHLGLDELRDFIMVGIDTGFRRAEILGLIPRDFVGGMVHLHAGSTKSDKARSVPATQRVTEILTRRSNQRTIFQLTVPRLRNQWLALKAYLGLSDDVQFVVHMLRHTCASRMVQKGVPLAVVQAWLGHSNIMTTMRYAHLAPNSLQAGLAALEQVMPTPQLRLVNA
jgi:integrase